jgi:hypothetical protein
MPEDTNASAKTLSLVPKNGHFELSKESNSGQTETLSLAVEELIALERLAHNRLVESMSRIQPNPLGISPIAALPLTASFVGPNSLNSEVILGLKDTLGVTMRYRMSLTDALDLSDRLRACVEKARSTPQVSN